MRLIILATSLALGLVLAGAPAATRAQAVNAAQPAPSEPVAPPSSATPGYTTSTLPQTSQPPSHGGKHGGGGKFAQANTTHDGHLTIEQAKAANMKGVVRNFSKIDVGNKGYITQEDLKAFHQNKKTKRTAGGTPPAPAQ